MTNQDTTSNNDRLRSESPVVILPRMKSLPLPHWFALVCFLVAGVPAAWAGDATTTQAAITGMLQEFLAKNTERAQHDRFWAEDLIYTGSGAAVRTKAEIMKSFDEDKAAPAKPKEPQPTYSAEDIVVRPYGTTAALTFRLVAHNPDGTVQYYRNSGTFLLRDGQWQVVTWQATKVPEKKP
ncbi:MAG: hypothetical protein JWQ62_145 [Lacunisphaera sp.]|nr:hypothetical protein [Lacunisphaera sp.]